MSAHSLILHHYEASPYAEKIRLMFGIADAEWQSLLCPPQPPRPMLDPLTGGYRRIPVAQLGADIFCDTALIAEEVAAMTGHTELAPCVAGDPGSDIAAQAEGQVFFAAITSIPPLKLIGTLLGNYGLLGTLRFVKDRSGMMSGGTVKPPRGADAMAVVTAFMAQLDSHLEVQSFVAGDTITYADLAVFHPLWLHMRVGNKQVPTSLPNVKRWFAGIEALGHGRRQEIDQQVAFSAASDAEPRPLPEGGLSEGPLGKTVSVSPADYGRDPVTGVLVWMGDDRVIVARQTDEFGTLHVHFPRRNYQVDAL